METLHRLGNDLLRRCMSSSANGTGGNFTTLTDQPSVDEFLLALETSHRTRQQAAAIQGASELAHSKARLSFGKLDGKLLFQIRKGFHVLRASIKPRNRQNPHAAGGYE